MARMWLRNDQFERIAALLPGKVSDPGRTAADNRLFVEAVLWIARTGSPWRDLLTEFGPWNGKYTPRRLRLAVLVNDSFGTYHNLVSMTNDSLTRVPKCHKIDLYMTLE